MTKRERNEITYNGFNAGIARSPTWQSRYSLRSASYRIWIDSYNYVNELRIGGHWTEKQLSDYSEVLRKKIYG